MNVKASFARSDHRQLSHDDLFPKEREREGKGSEEQKRKRKKHQNGRKKKKIYLVSRKSPERSFFSLIKLFVLHHHSSIDWHANRCNCFFFSRSRR